MVDEFSFTVVGRPAPQGSKSYKGNNRFVEASKYLPAWRSSIVSAAKLAKPEGFVAFDVPVCLEVTFWVAKPKKPRWVFPGSPPDLDKFVRSVGDALTQAGVWVDDSLVCVLVASKEYVVEGDETGCSIRVTVL
jgi:crossover junction endodeoxyribonuclease RusA